MEYIVEWCCTLCIYTCSLKSILVFDLIYIVQFSSEKASLTQTIIASIYKYNNFLGLSNKQAENNLQVCFQGLSGKAREVARDRLHLDLYNISGDYRAEQCNGPNCINCLMENPSCEGYGDGKNHHSSKPGSPWRMECYKGRLLGTFLADLNQD